MAVRMIVPTWFDHAEESFSNEEVQFKMFCPSVETCCPWGDFLIKNLVIPIRG